MVRRRCRHPFSAAAGFVLPVALAASLVLVLSSLSLQTTTLQTRSRLQSTQRLRHAEDALLSAAQKIVADLNQQHACLTVLPMAEWVTVGHVCADPHVQAGLRTGRVLESSYEVLDWQPLPAAGGAPRKAHLTLRIHRDDDAVHRQGVVSVSLWGSPPRANDIQIVHLIGAGT
jgi:hypothetical protein